VKGMSDDGVVSVMAIGYSGKEGTVNNKNERIIVLRENTLFFSR
jgi:hypothetical protein